MAVKEKIDTRDEILDYLKSIERNLMWMCRNIGLNYSTGYSIFVQKTINLSDENLAKVNTLLEKNFKINGTD